MRKALTTVIIMLVACLQVARADVNTNAAPADEYFGPYSQSVLEIRNRLNDYDKLDAREMLDPSVGGYLDHLQLAIRDWQQKYPRDPWLPSMFAHLMREYWRAGQVSSEHGTAALAFMRAAYPDSAETSATVSLIYGSNTALAAVARDETAPAPYEPSVSYQAPAPYAVPPPYETPASYQTLPSYAVQEAPANDVASSDVPPVADDGSGSNGTVPDDAPTPPPMR